MGDRVLPRPSGIAGRVQERRLIEEAVEQAGAGEPSMTFVRGEAGVGKTHLAHAAADLARSLGHEVLWGQCVRFGAGEATMLPWVQALERWVAQADPADRAAVTGAAGAAQLLPSLGAHSSLDPVRLVQVADTLVVRIAELRPVLLVLDDVQWADAASRDTLTYLVAGFGSDRLAVLLTYRDEGLAPGDAFHGWLGDMRRLRAVREIRLERLSRSETAQQLELLLGGPPAPGLVDAVLTRGDGNAYLTELLATGLSLDDEHLPPGLPEALNEALLAAWHRLDPAGREVLRVLAVAGRPTAVDRLTDVCEACGLVPAEVGIGLVEAAHGGLVVGSGPESVWLRHPVLADVLYHTYAPGEAARVHRAWAMSLASASSVGAQEVRRLSDLARHLGRAGEDQESFRASISAAEAAGAARLWREEALHLRRATALWSTRVGSAADANAADLFERAAVACRRVSNEVEALEAGRQALDLARELDDPLRTSRLLISCAEAAWWLGDETDALLADHRAAVLLTREFPDRPEHAHALASLSEALSWRGHHDEAHRVAGEAVESAEHSGSPGARSHAYDARSFARLETSPVEVLDADTTLSVELAHRSGDPDRLQWALQGRVNFLIAQGRPSDAVSLVRDALEAALRSGAVGAAGWHCSSAVRMLADEGRLTESAGLLRAGLSLVGPGNANAALHLSGALLAVRRGELGSASLHLERALEQIPTLEARPGLEAPPVLAELLCAQNRPIEALDLLTRCMPVQSVDPRVCDEMLLWGARAAGEWAEASRLHGGNGARARESLARLVTLRASLRGHPFAIAGEQDLVQPALQAVFEAESSRCATGHTDPEGWTRAAALCEAAGLGWEAWRATWRRVLGLVASGASRSEVARPLRQVGTFARREGASALLRDVEDVARLARISLEEASVPAQQAASPVPSVPSVSSDASGSSGSSGLAGLTRREREVLSHLVAGRTYAEIAAALFISDKTVSTHVSHLLSKTGTTSRREVAALALRWEKASE